MEIKILHEAGYELALGGMAFSFQDECPLDDIPPVTAKTIRRANRLANQDGGHNKFLESIVVWMDVRAPLKFWKQMDTYRIGLTKQSKSTMHRLMASELTEEHFTEAVHSMSINIVNHFIDKGDFTGACDNLPDGYLQTRRICTSYKVLRHIIAQRSAHKLGEWWDFCGAVLNSVEHPELLEV